MEEKLPIIIFRGDSSVCYGVLKSFSEELRDALLELGEEVIYLDPDKDTIENYLGKRYKAVIAFMENMFYGVLPDGRKVFDLIQGPKFNYWPDYPAFYYQHVKRVPNDYYILTQDRNYVRFINRYFSGVGAFYLPPGGRQTEKIIPFSDREYELSFVGTFLPWEDVVKGFDMSDETTRVLVDKYLDYLVTYPNETTEEAYFKVLQNLGISVSDEVFVEQLSYMHRLADRGAARMYRQEIIQTILDRGITIDVFGDSWKKAPFSNSKYLKIHPEVSFEQIHEIYENSKMSLNVMTWHKDAITERVLDAMMAGSIVITDRTNALENSFEDKKEILYFDLQDISRVPDIICENLNNPDIASKGCQKALSMHTWKERARELLRIIDETSA